MRILKRTQIQSELQQVSRTCTSHTSQIDDRTTLHNVKIHQSHKTTLSLAYAAVVRRTSLKQHLTSPSILHLLLLLRKQMRLPRTPHNPGTNLILPAFIAITCLLHHVTGKHSRITNMDSSSRLLDMSNLTAAGRKAPLLSQTLLRHILMMLYP
jgi:hypothetical protein